MYLCKKGEEQGEKFACIFVFVCICFCICAMREEEQGERGFGKVLKLEGDRTFSSAPQRITSVREKNCIVLYLFLYLYVFVFVFVNGERRNREKEDLGKF